MPRPNHPEEDARGAPRVPVSMLVQYRFDTLEDFVTEYAVDLSENGIFVRTEDHLVVQGTDDGGRIDQTFV